MIPTPNPDIASAWLLIGFLIVLVLAWAAANFLRSCFYSSVWQDNDELLKRERKSAKEKRGAK